MKEIVSKELADSINYFKWCGMSKENLISLATNYTDNPTYGKEAKFIGEYAKTNMLSFMRAMLNDFEVLQTTEKEEVLLSCEEFMVNSEDLILKEIPEKGKSISIIIPAEFCNYDFGTVNVLKFSDDLKSKVKLKGKVRLQYYMKPIKKLFNR